MEFIPVDRYYSNFNFYKNNQIINLNKDKITNKYFYKDIVDEEGKIILNSQFRNDTIFGILIINGKTFGRNGKKINYQFIPFNKLLPIFIIPYCEKKEFSKLKINKYASCKFIHWKEKHPIGQLVDIIGNINSHTAFCEYQINSYGLNNSLKNFSNISKKLLNEYENNEDLIKTIIKSYSLQNRISNDIISIDPKGCTDIDDAIGYQSYDHYNIISIYISNVPLIIDILNLWDFLKNKVSSIYLSDKKRHMIPKIFSEDICSLKERKKRISLAMDIYIDNNTKLINKIDFNPCLISLRKNYSYCDPNLNVDPLYYAITSCLSDNRSFNYNENILDPHKVIEYFMIFMNKEIAKQLSNSYTLIYKSNSQNNRNHDDIPNDLISLMAGWGGFGSLYTFEQKKHFQIDNCLYAQVTSPIRRIVDLYNMVLLNKYCNIKFINKTIDQKNIDLNYINEKIKYIKKIQTQDILLNLCKDDKFLNKIHSGYIIEVKDKHYIVYFSDIQKILKVKKSQNCILYQKVNCKFFIFKYEFDINKKVRANLI